MRTSMGRGILLAILVFGFVGIASAQYRLWEPENGVPYRQGYHVEWYRSITSGMVDGEEYLCVAWSDTRNGDRDIFAELYDSDGNPLWGEEGEGGILVARQAVTRQEDPHVMPTSDGHWILTWIDYRNDFEIRDMSDVFMQKLNHADGSIMWPEGDPDLAGVAVSEVLDTREIAVQSFDDGNGGAVSVWVTNRNNNGDIYAMHMMADGTPDPNWTEHGVMVAGGPEDQSSADTPVYTADTDGAGGLIVGWPDTRDPNDDNLYANRINADGELVWGDSSGIAISMAAGDQGKFRMAPDGLGGAYFVWISLDTASVNNDDDIFGQHVQAGGTVDWQEDGEVLVYEHPDSTAWFVPSDVRIVNSAEGEAVIVWVEGPRDSDANSNLRTQRLSLDDNNDLVLNWGDDGYEYRGVVLCDAEAKQSAVRLSPDGSGGAVYGWRDSRGGNENNTQNAYAQRIDVDGDYVWGDQNGVLLSDEPLLQDGVIGRVVGTDACYVWFDFRRGSPGLYYQYLDLATGTAQLEEDGVQIVFGIDGNAKTPLVVYDRDHAEHAWFGWIDGRWGGLGRVPFVQKVDVATGERQFQANGVSVIPYFPFGDDEGITLAADSLDLIPDGEGGLYAGWEDNRTGYIQTLGFQRISSDGEPLWSDMGVALESPLYHGQYRPELQRRVDGGIFAMHDEYNEGAIVNIRLQKIDGDGTVHWENEGDSPGKWITEDMGNDNVSEVFTHFYTEDRDLLMVYRRNAGGSDIDIYASCYGVDEDSILWTRDISTVEGSRQGNVQAAHLEGGVLLVWEDQREGQVSTDLYGQIVYPNGQVAWEENGRALVTADGAQSSFSLGCNSEEFWLAWDDTRDPDNVDIYAQHFDADGQPLLEPEDGVQLTSSTEDQRKPRLVMDWHSGVQVAWESIPADQVAHVDLNTTHLNSSGEPVTDEGYPDMEGAVLCDAYHIQSIIQMVRDYENGSIDVWQDNRATGKEFLVNIYGQRVGSGLGVGEKPSLTQPKEWALEAAYPNPFNPSTQIGFFLPNRMNVTLTVYDVLGRQVKQLVDGAFDAGRHTLTWDGTDFSGRTVASGTYFYRLENNGQQLVRKMVLVK